MSVQVAINKAGAIPVCTVEGELDFNSAKLVLESVSPHIKENASLVIDLAGISRANSAGLALMIEWLATARRSGSTVTFHHIPDGLRQLASVCQVDRLI